jgi:hypothetical protein
MEQVKPWKQVLIIELQSAYHNTGLLVMIMEISNNHRTAEY